MINVNKLKKVKSNFPVMIGKGAISAKDCERLINEIKNAKSFDDMIMGCLLYTSPSPRDRTRSRMPSSA